MIRVAVVDDHPHVAIALRTLLDQTADIRLVAEAQQGSEVFSLVQRERPHVLLLDLLIEPEFDALSAVRDLRANHPNLRICLLSAHLEPTYVRDLLEAGVCGYILKDDDYVSRIEGIVRDLDKIARFGNLLRRVATDAAAEGVFDRVSAILKFMGFNLPPNPFHNFESIGQRCPR